MPDVGINRIERAGAIRFRIQKGACAMFKRISMALAIVLVLTLVSGAWASASAEGPEVPFKAYYPVNAAASFDSICGCLEQSFTPGGDGLASHLGVSLFYGHAHAYQSNPSNPIIQIGDGKLIAANGDYLTVHYEGTAVVIDQGQHIVTDGWYVITGGSGRFENTTGGGTYHVYVYTSGEKPNDLWFKGHLHNP
jgi:hypothetical protein